jgi:pyridoxine/pyridoxamine 5'-phosphate oxidase
VDITDLDADPLCQLSAWLDAARVVGQPMPEAMTIVSATSDAVPSARLVILRGLQRGLIFFTDGESDKGAELAANPWAAAVLHWLVPAHRQVRVAGPVEPVSGARAPPPPASARPPGTESEFCDLAGFCESLKGTAAARCWLARAGHPRPQPAQILPDHEAGQ